MKPLDREIELLRQRAQAALQQSPGVAPQQLPQDMADALRLVEQLRIYQTELEIQNQDLKAAQLQTEGAMRKYRRLFENLPLEGLLVDAQGFIVEANAVARRRFALHQQSSLQRRSIYQLFSMDSRAPLHAALASTEDVAQAPQCVLAAGTGGAPCEVDAHIMVVDAEAFERRERLMVLVDRTYERQLAIKHEEVSRSEERYRALFDRSRVPMLLIDPQDGRIVRANTAAVAFYGHGLEALLQLRITDINCLSPEETQAEMRLAASQKREHFFFRHRLAGAASVPVEVHSGPIEIDGRTLLYSIIHDITARVLDQQRAAQAIQQYQDLLSAASEVSIISTDRSGLVQIFNRGAERMLGYSAMEVVATMSATQFHLPEQMRQRAQELSQEWGEPIEGFQVFTARADREGQDQRQWTYVRKDGAHIDVSLVVTTVRDMDGAITGYLGIAQDISQRLAAQSQMRLSASVFTHAREGILICDAQGLVLDVNAAFTRITGYERGEILGKNPRILKSGRQDRDFYAAMWHSLLSAGHWEGEVWNRRKNGEVYAELLSISAVRNSAAQVINYVALLSDISVQKMHEQELEHIASYDVLTGLPNRALLADRLQQEIAHSQRLHNQLAVVFIDLDGFKHVNDQHGHTVGDELLVTLALRMKAALRDGDTLARLGGDEFVAVLAGLEHPRDSEAVLTRLLHAAAEPVDTGSHSLRVSASIGVTVYPQDAVSADQLLRHADHAMYQAKQAGKNRYHYFDVLDDAEVKSHRESLEAVDAALDGEQFVLHYQPKVNMRTGQVVGMEALIRWQHPQRGLLLPQEFLPIIKDHPLSIKLGDWVIRTAVAQLMCWNAGGMRLSASVNIDALHLQQGDFVARLQAILASNPDLQPGQLEFEVLETSALEDLEHVSALMRACHLLGVGFSLDDFGTGYSSLTYLKRLPVDLMKIDQSFVVDMVDDADDFVIVEGVVGLATAFGRSVVAEGVETLAHGELLLALGCELGQGYGIARPMPAEAVPLWVNHWRPAPSWSSWQQPVSGESDRDLVLAHIKHRHWVRDVQNYVAGARTMAPPLHAHACALGVWLADQGYARYHQHPAFPGLLEAHERVHGVARELVQRFHAGESVRAAGGFEQLHALRDELIAIVGQLASR